MCVHYRVIITQSLVTNHLHTLDSFQPFCLPPGPLLPPVTTNLSSVSMSLFFVFFLFNFFQTPYMSEIIWFQSFTFLFISLNVIPSMSTHIVRNGNILFFLMAKKYSIVYIHHIFFIRSYINGHLGCFHILAIINKLL